MSHPETDAAVPDTEQLRARIQDLERERTHLLALVEILQEISGSLNFVDILQSITRKLGETFGLDRCSIFLAERGGSTARLVASYENPSIRNYVVDLERYPELKRALQSGEVVFIPDAEADPELSKRLRGTLAQRKVRTITVVPITWRRVVIGAIFLRTFRDGAVFSDEDIEFTKAVGLLTAKALRVAYRYERLSRRLHEQSDSDRRANLERVAFVGLIRRLTEALERRHGSDEDLLARASREELDRLTEITMAVLAEEGKGR